MRRRKIGAQMMILALVLLAGCGRDSGAGRGAEELALEIRTEYIGMTALSAGLEVTADYGERVYTYGMALAWDQTEGTTLTLTAPEEVAGVTLRVQDGETALEYDGVRLETGAAVGGGGLAGGRGARPAGPGAGGVHRRVLHGAAWGAGDPPGVLPGARCPAWDRH